MAVRVESGAVKFGDDWAGAFLRGADALYFGAALSQLLTSDYIRLTPINVEALAQLRDKLLAVNEQDDGDVAYLRPYSECKSKRRRKR